MPIGALISAGASLLAGSKQKKEARRAELIARRQHKQAVERDQANLRDAVQRADKETQRQDKWAQKSVDMAYEFAKQGLRWKVDDARAAGIHPLYALGASTHSPSPVSVGGVSTASGGSYSGIAQPVVDTGMSNALANAGQDIGRAVHAMTSSPERLSAYQRTMQALQIRNLGLEGEILASQLSKMRAGTGPGMPVMMAGESVYPNPGWSDAEAIQSRYGEPAEWAYFPFVAGADVNYNYKRKWKGDLDKWKRSLPADEFRYKWFQ